MSGILFIITSPSGGGKGTLIREILRADAQIGYSVSYTTRRKRPGETDGKEYFFVAPEEFKKRAEAGEFLEFASVHGNFYGTSQKQVESETAVGHDIILEIDVQGADLIKRRIPEAVGVFILPPSYTILRERLINRQTETVEDLQLRLRNAVIEVRECRKFDYVVINDHKDRAVIDLQTIVAAERLKPTRQITRLQDIISSFDSTANRT